MPTLYVILFLNMFVLVYCIILHLFLFYLVLTYHSVQYQQPHSAKVLVHFHLQGSFWLDQSALCHSGTTGLVIWYGSVVFGDVTRRVTSVSLQCHAVLSSLLSDTLTTLASSNSVLNSCPIHMLHEWLCQYFLYYHFISRCARKRDPSFVAP